MSPNHGRRIRLLKEFGERCYYCGEDVPAKLLTVDHYIPKSKKPKGMTNKYYLACKPCNRVKSDLWPDEFYMRVRKIFMHQYEELIKAA